MSILMKRGKEKLSFRIMNNCVSNRDFKYLKELCVTSLNENQDIAEKLDNIYKRIQVYFYYEATDPNVVTSLRDTLDDPSIKNPIKTVPGITYSRKNIGCILFFLKHYNEFIRKRTDIKNVKGYIKNGLFEDFCHLVEQNGDGSIHPKSDWRLWNTYYQQGLMVLGNQIVNRLDTDRNHYEVYLMMLRAYPDDWVIRYSKYFSTSPEEYRKGYKICKKKNPARIAYALLVTHYLRTRNVLYVAEHAKKEKILEKNKKLLRKLIEDGKNDIESKRTLINKDMGRVTLSLIDCIDESVFKTPDIFFSVVFDLWENLKLI